MQKDEGRRKGTSSRDGQAKHRQGHNEQAKYIGSRERGNSTSTKYQDQRDKGQSDWLFSMIPGSNVEGPVPDQCLALTHVNMEVERLPSALKPEGIFGCWGEGPRPGNVG